MLSLPRLGGYLEAPRRHHCHARHAEERQQPRYVFSVGQVACEAAVSPNNSTGASGDEADSSINAPTAPSPPRPRDPLSHKVATFTSNSATRVEQQTVPYPDTSDDIADNLLDEYNATRSIRYPAVAPVAHLSPTPVPSQREGSSIPPLTSPAPAPCDTGSNAKRMDAHDPTPTGQLYSHLSPS